jgi:hypothetical protein
MITNKNLPELKHWTNKPTLYTYINSNGDRIDTIAFINEQNVPIRCQHITLREELEHLRGIISPATFCEANIWHKFEAGYKDV